MSQQVDAAPVVIAGGGLVGLSTAMFLAQQGIASVVVERLRGGSALPRAAHFHLRTLELFRQAGIEQDVIAQSEREFLPEGAIIAMDNLSGRKLADIIGSLNAGVEALSPCRRLFISQPGLEPILKERSQQSGARTLEGQEIIGLAQDAEGVSITIRDVDSNREQVLRTQYLVAADGGHSKVRELLQIPFDGRGVFSNSITIYFVADLRPQLEGKPISVIYINNPVFGGFFRLDKRCQSGFLAVNTVGDPKTDPEAPNPARDVSESRLIELVRIGAGVPDLDVQITGVARWRSTTDIARSYQDGRVFLAGDAAHLMPPNGGFGGNTGVHDAHNLAWKLAHVRKGKARPELLDTYHTERRPVGSLTVEQAYARYVTRTAMYLQATDFQPVVPDFNIELGYEYHSAAILSENDDDRVHDDPHLSHGRPGSRAPHVWIDRAGQRVSSLDLFGRGYVLLVGLDGDHWSTAAAALDVQSVKLTDPALGAAYGISPAGASLIRPDGFVAWRAPAATHEPPATLGTVLERLFHQR